MAERLDSTRLATEPELEAAIVASPYTEQAMAHPAIEQLLAYSEEAYSEEDEDEASEEGRAEARSYEERPRSLAVGLHVGTLTRVDTRTVSVSVEGTAREATLPHHVDADFLRLAMARGELVLLQNSAQKGLVALGVVQGNHPSKLVGERVEVIGASEVIVQSGKSALRLRADGVVDLIGARISASSRGLLRLVGRALRLN